MVKSWGVSEFESWEGEGARSQHLALRTVRKKHMPTLEMLNVSDKLNIYYSMQLCFPILHFQLIGNTLYVHGSWFVFHSYACWSQCYKNKRPDLPSFRFSCNCCKAGLERSMEIRRRSGWWCRKANVNKPWPQKVSWNQWHYGSEIRSQRINRGGGLPLMCLCFGDVGWGEIHNLTWQHFPILKLSAKRTLPVPFE